MARLTITALSLTNIVTIYRVKSTANITINTGYTEQPTTNLNFLKIKKQVLRFKTTKRAGHPRRIMKGHVMVQKKSRILLYTQNHTTCPNAVTKINVITAAALKHPNMGYSNQPLGHIGDSNHINKPTGAAHFCRQALKNLLTFYMFSAEYIKDVTTNVVSIMNFVLCVYDLPKTCRTPPPHDPNSTIPQTPQTCL